MITALVAILVAAATAGLTYLATALHFRRSSQLAHVSRQLTEFYGPLHGLERASYAYYEKLEDLYGTGVGRPALLSDPSDPPTPELLAVWKYAVRQVFMPINRQILEILLTKSDLLIEDEMPACLVDFCAHTTGYEVVLARWEDGDFTQLVSVINHPGQAYKDYLTDSYKKLKVEQGKKIGIALK